MLYFSPNPNAPPANKVNRKELANNGYDTNKKEKTNSTSGIQGDPEQSAKLIYHSIN